MNKLTNLFKQPDKGLVEKSKPTIGIKIALGRLTKQGRIKYYLNHPDIVRLLIKAHNDGAHGGSFSEWIKIMQK